MAKWSIRNYNAFIRAARKESDLTQGQAKTVYRQMSQKLGRPLGGVDVKKHPIIFGRAGRVATGVASKVARVSRGRAAGRIAAAPGGGAIGSLRQWEGRLDDFDDFGQYDYDEYESSANYGEV